MTAAVIKAAYADYRRVKGRKCLQLILEIPLEQAPQVHEAFGEPLPDGSTWVAVARLENSLDYHHKTVHDGEGAGAPGMAAQAETVPAPEPPSPHRLTKGGKLCQRAAIMCGEGSFWKFFAERYKPFVINDDIRDSPTFVRRFCGVTSRAELDHNPEAASKFLDLESRYKAWMAAVD